MSRIAAIALLLVASGPAAAQPARAVVAGDSLDALRERYTAEMRELVPQWKAAVRAAAVEDSLSVPALPPDTIRVGPMRWLVDASRSSSIQEALTRSWSHVQPAFGTAADVLRQPLFAARLRVDGGVDTSRKVIDLAQVVDGRLDIFDRAPQNEKPEAIADRITARASRLILQRGDSGVLHWLQDPYSPQPIHAALRERMHADLVTSASQVSSRCLAGDLARCRDALGLVPAADPLTEWYDAGERRRLVMKMHEILSVGPQKAQYDECVVRESDAACQRLLRTRPRYVVPPPLPMALRHHLFRVALQTGGAGAYTRLAAGPPRSVEARLADAAQIPIDSLVGMWRSDILAARPASPMPSLLSAWTAIAWGIAVLLVALRFTAWR